MAMVVDFGFPSVEREKKSHIIRLVAGYLGCNKIPYRFTSLIAEDKLRKFPRMLLTTSGTSFRSISH